MPIARMLVASPKAVNSSLPGMRGSLIPADTGVTGQAPNRPSELGEVAFAVTRGHPRQRRAGGCCWDPAALGSGWSLGALQAPG